MTYPYNPDLTIEELNTILADHMKEWGEEMDNRLDLSGLSEVSRKRVRLFVNALRLADKE